MQIESWIVTKPGEPMTPSSRDEEVGAGEVLVEVAGCGVCHTDLGFYYEGVPTRHPFPLTLGHEISGAVVAEGEGVKGWPGARVVVAAVIPCGRCAACKDGRGSICPKQIFPGNDVHGGFATHVKVPVGGLCRIPDLDDPAKNPHGVALEHLSVIADAVSTPYQAILRSGLTEGDLAIVVGAGGVGGFAVQIASAMGATVVAIDTNADRLAAIADFGATLSLRPDEVPFRELKKQVKSLAKEHGIPSWRHKIFECSGTVGGQQTAYGLVGHGAYLSVVGFTAKKGEFRLANLMAFDATAQGNWGCLPEHYPAIVDLVLAGKVRLDPFVEQRALSTINQTFEDLRDHRVNRRVILVPEK